MRRVACVGVHAVGMAWCGPASCQHGTQCCALMTSLEGDVDVWRRHLLRGAQLLGGHVEQHGGLWVHGMIRERRNVLDTMLS